LELAEKIGQAAFNFDLIFSIIITVIGISLLANGINPGAEVTGLFLPFKWIYGETYRISSTLPSQPTSTSITATIGSLGLLAIFLEFLFMLITGFLNIVYVIGTIVPAQLKFLVPALYFIGAFLQLMTWIYIVNQIVNRLASLIPGVGSRTTS